MATENKLVKIDSLKDQSIKTKLMKNKKLSHLFLRYESLRNKTKVKQIEPLIPPGEFVPTINKHKALFYPTKCEKIEDGFYIQKTFELFLQVFNITAPITDVAVVTPISDISPVEVTAVRIGNNVTVQFPGISFQIPDSPDSKFIFSVNKPIPKVFRPTSAKPVATNVSSHLTDNPPFEDFPATGDYELQIYNNGEVEFSLPGGYPIPAGQFITEAATISYVVSPIPCPLDNFIIATWGPSNSLLTQNVPANAFLEYNGLDLQHGKLFTVWADNNNTQSGTIIKPLNLAFAEFKFRKNKLEQIAGPQYVSPSPDISVGEYSLAISPYNPNLIAFIGGFNIRPLPPITNFGDLYGISTDGGKTFQIRDLFLEGTITPSAFGADTVIGWDRFDNLWAAYLSADPINFFPFTIGIAGSPKGDPNKFRVVQVLTGSSIFGLDYPWLATGPSNNETGALDGGRPESVWVTCQQVNDDDVIFGLPSIVNGFQVNGPLPDDPNAPLTGIVVFNTQYLLESGKVGTNQSVAVGPNGDVLVTNQTTGNALFAADLGFPANDVLFVSYNPAGLNGQFSTRRDITMTIMGDFESVGPQPIRGTAPFPRPAADRSNSPFKGRFYVVYVDTKVHHSGNGIDIPADGQYVQLTWTDNGGVSWADPIQVNNDPLNPNSHFEPTIALDQSTGNLAIGWYDARLDKGNGKCDDQDNVRNTDVRWSGAIITVDYLKTVEKQRKCPVEFKLK